MSIGSVSGASAQSGTKISIQPPKTEHRPSDTIIAQENEHKKSTQPGVVNNDLNSLKSLEEVDVKV